MALRRLVASTLPWRRVTPANNASRLLRCNHSMSQVWRQRDLIRELNRVHDATGVQRLLNEIASTPNFAEAALSHNHGTVLIKKYGRVGEFASAMDIFNRITATFAENDHNHILFNTALQCCVDNQEYEKGLGLFETFLRKAEAAPDAVCRVTFNTALQLCVSDADTNRVQGLLGLMRDMDITMDHQTIEHAVGALAAIGQRNGLQKIAAEEIEQLMHAQTGLSTDPNIVVPTVRAYDRAVFALLELGDNDKATAMLTTMLKHRLRPSVQVLFEVMKRCVNQDITNLGHDEVKEIYKRAKALGCHRPLDPNPAAISDDFLLLMCLAIRFDDYEAAMIYFEQLQDRVRPPDIANEIVTRLLLPSLAETEDVLETVAMLGLGDACRQFGLDLSVYDKAAGSVISIGGLEQEDDDEEEPEDAGALLEELIARAMSSLSHFDTDNSRALPQPSTKNFLQSDSIVLKQELEDVEEIILADDVDISDPQADTTTDETPEKKHLWEIDGEVPTPVVDDGDAEEEKEPSRPKLKHSRRVKRKPTPFSDPNLSLPKPRRIEDFILERYGNVLNETRKSPEAATDDGGQRSYGDEDEDGGYDTDSDYEYSDSDDDDYSDSDSDDYTDSDSDDYSDSDNDDYTDSDSDDYTDESDAESADDDDSEDDDDDSEDDDDDDESDKQSSPGTHRQ